MRGRKADAGTYEAREYIKSGKMAEVVEKLEIGADAKVRIMKAVKFGLGIKE